MRKGFCNLAFAAIVSAASALSLSSCVNEDYDVSNINKEITLAGDGLTLPLGSTKQLSMKNVLSGIDVDLFRTLEDGSYAIGVNDKLDLASVLPDMDGMESVQDAAVSSSVKIPMHQGHLDHLEGKFSVDLNDEFEFAILKASYATDMVKGIETISFADASLNMSFAFYDLPDFGAGKDINVDMTLTLPEEIVLDQNDERVDGNVVKISSSLSDGMLKMDPVSILAMDLSGYDMSKGKDLIGKVKVEGVLYVQTTSLDIKKEQSEMSVSVAIRNLDVEKIVAHVEYDIDATEQHIAMDGFPEFMKDDSFVLDVVHPHMMIKVKTNMGIPASGNLLITPVVNGEAHEADMITASLSLPASPTSEKTDSVTYWLGDESTLCPEGCVFVKAEIGKLIRKIPDEFLFKLSSTVDYVEDCVIEPAAEYNFEVEYDFVLPLDFGKDLHIEMADTLTGLSGVFGQMFEKNSVQLSGDVTSCLPVQLDLRIDMLDARGNVIKTDKPITQKIAARNADGTASVSPISLTMGVAKGESVLNVDALKVSFVVTSPDASGPIKETDYVQANLSISLPDGLTVDLDEINNEN